MTLNRFKDKLFIWYSMNFSVGWWILKKENHKGLLDSKRKFITRWGMGCYMPKKSLVIVFHVPRFKPYKTKFQAEEVISDFLHAINKDKVG